ncbi:FAD-dependent oxidoreductase [Nocardia sp. NPDC127526]|uniref:FAD-dependent oxidoreductase n=1 Tax=Nocardia sp. NPDC127526 TaxID=3345393 RepID=UPI00362E1F5A
MNELGTTVCIAGGGPAGMMLGLLLARAGIEVVVLEKHADFLRDFRGDTVHPATLEILDDIGLGEDFHALPHQRVSTIGVVQGGRRVDIADFRMLRVRHPYMAFVPQWDFLTLLARAAERYPTFRLIMNAEVVDVLRAGGHVAGVRVRGPGGEFVVRSTLTVGADGRHSALRRAMGMAPKDFASALDVIFFRISRRDTDPDEGICVRIGNGRVFGATDRGTYWQMSYETSRGAFERLRETDLSQFRADLAELVPFLADRVDEIRGIGDLSPLECRIDRLPSWHRPGILFIGDAAHAMSPVAGFGVNLAIQDAVAAANTLWRPLYQAQEYGAAFDHEILAAVRRRRVAATALSQGLQRLVQRFGIDGALREGGKPRAPVIFECVPILRKAMSRIIGTGFRPEHVRVPHMGKEDVGVGESSDRRRRDVGMDDRVVPLRRIRRSGFGDPGRVGTGRQDRRR